MLILFKAVMKFTALSVNSHYLILHMECVTVIMNLNKEEMIWKRLNLIFRIK